MKFRTPHLFYFCVAATAFCIGPAAAQSSFDLPAEDGSSSAREWQSENRNYQQLSKEVADLYVALYNGGALPVHKILDSKGKTIGDLMYELGYFRGSYFPLSLDALACDINPTQCSRELVAVGSSFVAPTEHIALSVPTGGRWKNGPGDEVLLPAIKFVELINYSLHKIEPGDSLQEIVVDITRGCEKYDSACVAKIESKNRLLSGLFDKDFSGELFLPTLALRANLSNSEYHGVTEKHASSMEPGFLGLLVEQFSHNATPEFDIDLQRLIDEAAATSRGLIVLKGETPPEDNAVLTIGEQNLHLDRAIRQPDSISGNVSSSISKIFKWSVPDVVSTSVNDLHAFHRNPFRKVEDIPDELKGRIDVAILDEHFDVETCGLQQRFAVYDKNNGWSESSGDAECDIDFGFNLNDKIKRSDHGTHIAGIIGSLIDGEAIGVNPFAHIVGIEIPVSQVNETISQTEIVDRLKLADDQYQPVVYNLSIGYRRDTNNGGQADRILEYIRESKNSALFVVAAGNGANGANGVNLKDGCDLLPACASLPNLITVVAATPQGGSVKRASYSHFNDKQFHIAAIGTDVASLVSSNEFRVASGTSQAAPYVAAAASLLMKKHRMLPVRVKQRIVACSNVEHGLIGGIGGLLDVGCLLEVDSDLLMFDGSESKGIVIRAKADSLKYFPIDGGPEILFSFDSILAIARENNNTFTVFKTRDFDDVESISGLLPSADEDMILLFKNQDDQIIEVKVDELDRWVRRVRR